MSKNPTPQKTQGMTATVRINLCALRMKELPEATVEITQYNELHQFYLSKRKVIQRSFA
jgi:hypothetical protein